MKHWIDATRTVSPETEVYGPGEACYFERQLTVSEDGCDLSRVSMGCHCGTHVDAPAHFIEGGATIDQMPCDLMVGPTFVTTLREGGAIGGFEDVDRVVLRLEAPGLTEFQAHKIVTSGVKLLGVDRLSVATGELTGPVHRILLGAGLYLIETLDLTNVPDGAYEMACLPLKLEGCEAAPARVLFREL